VSDTLSLGVPERPRYRFQVIPRTHSVAVFDEKNPVNYLASCQIAQYGDVGWMFSINGKYFYDAFSQPGLAKELMEKVGVKTLEGYVVPSHARLMRIALRDACTVEIKQRGEMAGHEMVWVVVRAI
jgi:hypothetical protein